MVFVVGVCMCFVYVYVCAGNICMSADAQGGQNRVTDTLELDKREVVGAKNRI